MDVLLKNNKGLKILTDTGFSDFEGLIEKSIQKLLSVNLTKSNIKCTPDHKIFLDDLSSKESKDLKTGDKVYTSYGIDLVVSIDKIESERVYDVFDVKNNNRFYANDILIKNCEFLIYDETLVSSIFLAEMRGKDPYLNMGQTRWYKKLNRNSSYVVSLDPAMGTGGDNAAIQIIEIGTYEQVGEWMHNTTAVPGQIHVLKEICKYIAEVTQSNGHNIYWSIENNTIGEAALIVINEMGEESIPGLFISEPIKKGHVRKFRRGFNTTHATKISACSRMKSMIESKTLKINSKPFISELKAFVANGHTFKAKDNQTDDLISAMLLIIRMLHVMKDWDQTVYQTFVEASPDEAFDTMPMPIFVAGY